MPMRRFYQQPSLFVATYDLLNSPAKAGLGVEGDVDFYRSLATERGGPILELACGTGRVAFPLAEDGFDVVGVDRSRPMLSVAESKHRAADPAVASRLEFIEGDMRDIELGRTFRLVIIAFRSFAHLLTVDDQHRCLQNVRRHLDQGGVLALNVFDPRLDLCMPDVSAKFPQPRGRADLTETATHVDLEAVARRNDPVLQVMTETWRLTERTADGTVLREEIEGLVIRWTYRYELHHLLRLSGFEEVVEYSDFKRSPATYGRELVVVASNS
jgi:ubiquinone/menaquinone biosynthesis C-methylase UbiE